MSVAFDAESVATAGVGDLSWTHTPVGTPRAAIVLIDQALSGTDSVTGVTYGGETMTEVSGSPNLLTSGELGGAHCFFLGSSVPTGAQTVYVTSEGGAIGKKGVCYTLTAGGDCEVTDTDGTINSASLENPQVTLSLGGETCFCAIGFFSGQGDPSGITPFADWTVTNEHDHGAATAGFYRYDIIGTTDVTAGWTQSADDAVAMAVAVNEVASGQKAVGITDITITFST